MLGYVTTMATVMPREEFERRVQGEMQPVQYFTGAIMCILCVLIVLYYTGVIPCPKFVNSYFGIMCVACILTVAWVWSKAKSMRPLFATAPPEYLAPTY